MTLEGQQIGRYRIIRSLGRGGMGEVYLARDMGPGPQVAIRVITIKADLDPEQLYKVMSSFTREARAIARLDHPYILPLFSYGRALIDDTNLLYLVMPYRSEGSLAQWLLKRTSQKPQDVALMILQAAMALQYVHNHQIIHQDVKPSSFLLHQHRERPTRPDLLLSNFSVERFGDATSNVSQNVRGTPAYMAPEQWQGEPVFATDQYALAIMAYELFTGRPPFQGSPHLLMSLHINESPEPISLIDHRLPPALDLVLRRALAKRPQERYPSILAFAEALQQALPASPEVLRVSLTISPKEAEQGTKRTIRLPGDRSLTVVIPPKVHDGQLIVLEGEGEKVPEGEQRGDVLLTVRVNRENIPPDMLANSTVQDSLDEEDDVQDLLPVQTEMPTTRRRNVPSVSAPSPSDVPSMSSWRRHRPVLQPHKSSTIMQHKKPFFSSSLHNIGDQIRSFIKRLSRKKPLPLFAIARAELEKDDRAAVGKMYLIEAGIAQHRPAYFRGVPFILPNQDGVSPISFDVIVQSSDNIDLGEIWQKRLRYDPRNVDPQLVTFPFRFTEAGHGTLLITFYQERYWLKTIHFEIEATHAPDMAATTE